MLEKQYNIIKGRRQPTPEEEAAAFKAYAEVGCYFWNQIEALDPENRPALHAYTYMVSELEDLFTKRLALGYMGNLSLWLGLKEDAPGAAENYGQGIKSSYPQVFDEQESNNLVNGQEERN